VRTHRRVYDDPEREDRARVKYAKAVVEAYDTLFAVTRPAEEACDEAVRQAQERYEAEAGPYKTVPIRRVR
jgi:hypothetical protein